MGIARTKAEQPGDVMLRADTDDTVDAAMPVSTGGQRTSTDGAIPARVLSSLCRLILPERYGALIEPPAQSSHWALRWKRVSLRNLPETEQ